ncbi:MAG TPA: response regulator [Bryobacteraceae bacterium]|nr:response regulator [Bryobacteraceae bacterium]
MLASEIHPASIVVVEDSPSDVLLLRHALSQHSEPFELQVLRDGAEALQFLDAQLQSGQEPAPCVIVLDLHLPKHDGLSVLAALRSQPGLSHIRVVALSSFASPRDEAEVHSLGVRLYCEKPGDLDGWIALARNILDICREPAAVAY